MDVSKILYYLNQGGPAAQAALVYAAYYGYQLVMRLVTAVEAQNVLLQKLLDKESKLV